MRRTSVVALLAIPVLLAFPGFAHANPPRQCYFGHRGGGFCLLTFPRIHQVGPLFNYGPYYGYPPFEPYGPWNSYLHYNGGYGGGYGKHGHGSGHGDKSGHGPLLGSHGGLFGGHGKHGGDGDCGGHGFHSSWRQGGWFKGHGCLSCGHGGSSHGQDKGCAGCKADAFDPATTDPATRYAGTGSAANAAVFYAGLPTIEVVGGLAK
jgi:hypothetical protein